ncbi:class I SAM-dependent methyltransferase [Sporolactobacillus vineae]|uniref:class I SAM-dependent methyltransferase n=1 Tax=Sporolactobacillus vineae TaxID=444463 RepID=UPI00028813F1|nr:class I SAM-dependent methyltransferase [Sporolactobacillus vineae]
MSTLNQRIQKRYNRISGIYDTMDQMIRESWRRELLGHVHGRVLEAGVGTGANLPFYPEKAEVTGIDFSRGMLDRARKKLEQGPNNSRIHLEEADIQALPFADDTFDFVVSTCVFCSVPDPVLGLRELKRVCKPDGRILMLEHMRSKNPVVGVLMDLLNPLTVRLWGANINRRTMDNIRRAGLTVLEEKPLFYSILKKLVLRP